MLSLISRRSLLSVVAVCLPAVLSCIGNVAVGQKAITVAPSQVRVQFDGLDTSPGAVDLHAVKMGSLSSASNLQLSGGGACSEGSRLVPGSVSIICKDTRGALAEWHKSVLAGKTDRKSGSIIYLDREGNEVLREYNLFDCFPTSYRNYEPEDCDDTAEDWVTLEIQVGAITLTPRQRVGIASRKGYDKYKELATEIVIDGCAVGGPCPGSVVSTVQRVSLLADAAAALPGAADAWIGSATACVAICGPDDDCDGIFRLVGQSQIKPTSLPVMKVKATRSRSNIQNNRLAGPSTTLNLTRAQILKVTLPTFQFSPSPKPGIDTHIVEEIEFVVEKVERG